MADYFHKSIHVLDFVLANYVFPFSWKLWRQQVNLNPRIFVTFGINPHLVDRSWGHFWNELIHLVFFNSCVVIQFFQECVLLSKNVQKPLVIHCRDSGNGEAANIALNVFEDSDALQLEIHRHCFSGTIEELTLWIDKLPNVKFGITSKHLTANTLKKIPLNKLLLESDSPNLSAHGPLVISSLATQVSKILNIPPTILIKNMLQKC